MAAYVQQRLPLKFKGKLYNPTYRPLSPKYKKIKRERYGNRPMLVASGKLKYAALHGSKLVKSNNEVVISFNVPYYGKLQIRAGRNWAKFNTKDIRWMRKRFIQEFAKLRAETQKSRGQI